MCWNPASPSLKTPTSFKRRLERLEISSTASWEIRSHCEVLIQASLPAQPRWEMTTLSQRQDLLEQQAQQPPRRVVCPLRRLARFQIQSATCKESSRVTRRM